MSTENHKKIVVLGPVLPFRGGIAQHTTMLKRALAKKSDLLALSFSRQYPGWLFPGESDRDPSYEGHMETATEYLIDSLNPLTWKKAITRVINFNAEIVLIPWWTVFWAPCFGFISRALKNRGIEVIFFCHNVIEHEASNWKTMLTRNVLKNAQRFIVHTKEDKSNLLALLPNAKITVHPHPIYEHFPEAEGKYQRRKSLELLFYGFVRPYKGLDDLIDAMLLLKDKDIQLTVAGEFWKGKDETSEKIYSLGLNEQIELRPRYHSDQETAELFHRADIIVLPYRSATGSGVVPIAYHYNKPVIVTHVGGLPDVVLNQKTGVIVPANDSTSLAEAIAHINQKTCELMVPQILEFKKSLTWDSLASVIVQ